MPSKKWVARILWWHGKNPKPRKNQTVTSRLIKAKTIEELAKKITHARKRSWQLIESGGRQDPGGYFTKLLENKIVQLSKTEKEVVIDALLSSLPMQPDPSNAHHLTLALGKLSIEELRLLVEHLRVLHDKQFTESPVS
ncbi:hypothetical protein L0244_37215 [bacterium]|nr:hypothetical protein [bacterium]